MSPTEALREAEVERFLMNGILSRSRDSFCIADDGCDAYVAVRVSIEVS